MSTIKNSYLKNIGSRSYKPENDETVKQRKKQLENIRKNRENIGLSDKNSKKNNTVTQRKKQLGQIENSGVVTDKLKFFEDLKHGNRNQSKKGNNMILNQQSNNKQKQRKENNSNSQNNQTVVQSYIQQNNGNNSKQTGTKLRKLNRQEKNIQSQIKETHNKINNVETQIGIYKGLGEVTNFIGKTFEKGKEKIDGYTYNAQNENKSEYSKLHLLEEELKHIKLQKNNIKEEEMIHQLLQKEKKIETELANLRQHIGNKTQQRQLTNSAYNYTEHLRMNELSKDYDTIVDQKMKKIPNSFEKYKENIKEKLEMFKESLIKKILSNSDDKKTNIGKIEKAIDKKINFIIETFENKNFFNRLHPNQINHLIRDVMYENQQTLDNNFLKNKKYKKSGPFGFGFIPRTKNS